MANPFLFNTLCIEQLLTTHGCKSLLRLSCHVFYAAFYKVCRDGSNTRTPSRTWPFLFRPMNVFFAEFKSDQFFVPILLSWSIFLIFFLVDIVIQKRVFPLILAK